MAQMLPSRAYTSFPDDDGEAEEFVFDKLEDSLPDDYLVYHSVDWIRTGEQEFEERMQGEIDYLVLNPEGRILLLEVKSGAIGYDRKKGHWFRRKGGERVAEDTNPLEQLWSARKRLVGELAGHENLGRPGRYPGLVGTGLCFPHMNEQDAIGLDRLDFPTDRILFYDELNEGDIEEEIDQVLEQSRRDLDFDPDGLEEHEKTVLKEDALSARFDLPRSLRNQLDVASEAVFRLKQKQLDFLDVISHKAEAYTKGYAGSGKTVLSIEQARRLADKGLDVLWLCYNKVLHRELSERFETEGLEVSHYHEFADLFCRDHDVNIFDHEDDDPSVFWTETVPELFLQTAEASDRTYDAIIIDEAQDFLDSYVFGLQELLGDDGKFYVFYDPAQNVYHDDLPDWLAEKEDDSLFLPWNVRNTREISLVSGTLGDVAYGEHVDDLGPSGAPVRVSTAEDLAGVQEELRTSFHQVFQEEGVVTDRAVVLGYRRFENTLFAEDPELGNYTVVDAKERVEDGEGDFDPGEVRYFTIHSFKGLDEDLVFLINPEAGEKQRLDYTGASRARSLLWIITADPDVPERVEDRVSKDAFRVN